MLVLDGRVRVTHVMDVTMTGAVRAAGGDVVARGWWWWTTDDKMGMEAMGGCDGWCGGLILLLCF